MHLSMSIKCILWTGIFLFLTMGAEAQFKKRRVRHKSRNSKSPFEETQWWLGFRTGGNLTQASPGERFTAFSTTTQVEEGFYDKTYQNFNKLGAQAGLDVTFFHKGFSVSFQPNYRRQQFTYSNEYQWVDTDNAANTLELMYTQDHQLDYIEFPLSVKYDILQTQLRPFVHLGAYYGTLLNANKSIVIEGTDAASGNVNPFQSEEIIVGATDLFLDTSWGFLGGIGGSYNVGNVRIVLDVTYRYGMNNITSAKNRFTENRLAGVGDALDDVKMRNISFSLGVLFPMRFLEVSSYRAVD